MADYLGDYAPGTIVYGKFNSAAFSDGSPITLAGTPALSVYKDDSTTESTSGVTLTVDLDSRTGMHQFKIDTSSDGTFYAAGNDFDVVITAGTVGGTSVIGRVVGSFSLNNRSALRPTTAGRSLDVSAGGEAGVDWANVGSPTTSLNLSATTFSTSQVVASVSGAVASVTARVTANADQLGGQTVTASAPITANANLGTTQPVNFFGTGASAVVRVDINYVNDIQITGSGTTLDPWGPV